MTTVRHPRRSTPLSLAAEVPGEALFTVAPVPVAAPRAARSPLADYFELTKPRIALMALITVAAGYLLGSAGDFHWLGLLNTLLGAGLVAAGGSALNHWLERKPDAKMHRTARRPLPAGRVPPVAALLFGVTLFVAGTAWLAVTLPYPGASIAAAATGLLYVGVYTPMKRLTSWNTVVGAIPGALPPVIGWCAAQETLTLKAVSLFAILFVWQLPHFYAIAFMHREDYARGGMKMLPVVERADGFYTGLATVGTAALLVPVTVLPFAADVGHWLYLLGAVPLAVWFLLRAARFARHRTTVTAKSVLRGSLVYLTGVMVLLAVDGLVG